MVKLFAFWRYDLFPYVLGGEFEEMTDDGLIKAISYGNACFRPFKILPVGPGQKLLAKLMELREDHASAIEEVNQDFKSQLDEILPEANKLWKT